MYLIDVNAGEGLSLELLNGFSIWDRKASFVWAVVLAQLVEWSRPTQEIHGLNPVIGKIYMHYQLYWKDKKEAWNGPFLKTTSFVYSHRFCNDVLIQMYFIR